MSCYTLHGGRACGLLRPAGALKRMVTAPSLRSQVLRRLQTKVSTAEVELDRELWLDRANAADEVAAELAPEQTFRKLPVNYAPETRFTVDNVGAADAANFQIHPSVEFWARFTTKFSRFNNPAAAEDQTTSTGQQLDAAAATVRDLLASSALADAESAAYWTYHLSRAGFFLGTAAAGAVSHHLATQLRALSTNTSAPRTAFDNLSRNAGTELANRVYEAIGMFKQDLQNIKDGKYKLPWDMTTPSHRQYNPLFILNKSVQFVSEAIGTLDRRINQASTDNWFASNLYPQYYADNTFHYQKDGWLSSRSASIYEFSTEALFFGRQDAMQRTALLPLADYIRDQGLDPSVMTLLEVSCGTGRFHTFIKDNYPTMRTIASDLSPFYLARARDNVAYWKRQRAPGLQLGRTDDTGTDYMQCAMESIPLPNSSLDALICVYAFHEMPEEARAAAAAEFYRVLKPGGLMVLTDSVQLGDRPEWDNNLGAFGNFNEPYYRNYIACDLGALFKAAGFTCDVKYLASATKTLSFHKPQTNDGGMSIMEASVPASATEEVLLSAAAAGAANEAAMKDVAELN
eukprot:gene7520-7731_t